MLENYKWAVAQNKVNRAVKTFQKAGLGYSVTNGIVGNYSDFSRKDRRKIEAAAKTMGKLQAGYYPQKSNRGSNNSNITTKPAYYEPFNRADHDLLQQKSIEQSKSSMPLKAAQTFIHRICYNPSLRSHPTKRVLGITAEEASEWSNNVEALWKQDKRQKDWDESLCDNYNQLSDLAFMQLLGAGEYFGVIRNYIDDPDHKTNVTVELYNPLQIQSPRFAYGNYAYRVRYTNCNQIVNVSSAEYYSDLPKGNYIERGIEYNKKNQEVAIFIAPTKFGEPYIKIPVRNSKGFTQVIHGFIKTEPGQKRGLPDSSYAWHEFMNIRDLKRFEMQSARLNSTISGTVTADSNAMPNGQQGGMDSLGKGVGWSDGSTPDSSSLPDYEDPGYSVREVDGGGYIVQNFTPGYKYTEHNTSRPNLNIPIFIEKNLEYTHPATYGVSTTLVNQRLEGSYNASKGKIDISWKTAIEYYLDHHASDWDKPLYEAWLNGKVATGDIVAQGWEDPFKRAAWCNMSIITPAKPSLNPLQEAKAGEVRIGYGASTSEYEAQTQTGSSAEDNFDRLEMEYDRRKKLNDILNPQEEGVV